MKVRTRQRDRKSVEMWKGRERGEVVEVKGKGIEIAERNR